MWSGAVAAIAGGVLSSYDSLAALTTFAALGLRVYLAVVWVRFGLAKLEGGWLTTNPLKPLLTLIGAGQMPSTAPGYAPVTRMMVAAHADALLRVMIPLTEVGIGIALLSGVRVRTAALVATALNVNLLLSGVASWSLDGRMIVLQQLLVCVLTVRGAAEDRRASGYRTRMLREFTGLSTTRLRSD